NRRLRFGPRHKFKQDSRAAVPLRRTRPRTGALRTRCNNWMSSDSSIHQVMSAGRKREQNFSQPGLFLAVFVYQPFACGLLAEYPPAILVADPILIGHHWLQSFSLLGEFFQLSALLSEIIEPVLDGLSALTVRTVWIHRVESIVFHSQSNEPADFSFA